MLKTVLAVILLAMLFDAGSTRAESESTPAQDKSWADLPVPNLGMRAEGMMPQDSWIRHFVWVHVPQITGGIVDLLCYEHGNKLLSHKKLDGGAIELRHQTKDSGVQLVTTVTPEPGAVEVVVRGQLDNRQAVNRSLPKQLPIPNLCLRVKRPAEDMAFSCYPDPFPEFVSRCFIFTDKGLTLLGNTVRRKLPRVSGDDPRNNPPWVQVYKAVWLPVPQEPKIGWYNNSTDRFTIPVIGVVSRDRKHLVAMVTDSADSVTQAWQECLHNSWRWKPQGAPPEQQRLRMKVYIMPNDPDMLLLRIAEDFPEALTLQEDR